MNKVGVFGGDRGSTMIEPIIKSPDAELVAVWGKYHPSLDKIENHAEENGPSVALYNHVRSIREAR